MSTHALAVIALLTTVAAITVGLSLAAGASWPAALLAGLGTTLTAAALLPRSSPPT
jgi:hypothetical protein